MGRVALISLLSALPAFTDAVQPSAPSPRPAPLRALPWAQLNFVATTDIHGWLAGHLQEPSYSADWGDYVSFTTRLREKADKEGRDLLVIDSGDRVEGNGLYDASDPKGKYTFDIFKQQSVDILCIGNHELYKAQSAQNELFKTVPDFKNNYLASNIDIYNPRTNETQPLAARFKKFTTKNQGIRIIAFGFIFNFQQNANNTRVHKVEDTIKEKWFQDAIHDRDVDLFLITAHIGFLQQELYQIFTAIRQTQWDTPIAILGGHLHVRSFKKFDNIAWGLEAGRYLETIGFMSIDGLSTGGKSIGPSKTAKFQRRYIDHNLYSMYNHTGLNATTFPTAQGKNISRQITAAREALNLDKVLGCAPKSLWTSRVPFNSADSIYKWLQDEVLPDVFKTASNKTAPKMVIVNTGSIRFDIFKGPFTRDSTYLVSPFTSPFRRIRNVGYEQASQLLNRLNNGDVRMEYASGSELHSLQHPSQDQAFDQASVWKHTLRQPNQEQYPLMASPSLTPGYTTKDDGGDDGDDTIHDPLPSFAAPGCIQTNVDIAADSSTPETVDVIYNKFLEKQINDTLTFLGATPEPQNFDTLFDGRPMTDVMVDWIQEHWKCKD